MKSRLLIIALGVLATACAFNENFEDSSAEKKVISISGQINQEYKTRANDSGFCNGDQVGIYVVDYVDGQPGTLTLDDNRADNVLHTFDESTYKWVPAYEFYWKDKTTHVDIYGYYPYDEPTDVNKYTFAVQRDQSTAAENGKLAGYEASDFLWAKTADQAPTASTINLNFHHILASAKITLVEGEGFEEGEWLKLDKAVLVSSTRRNATIDLATGQATVTGDVASNGIVPVKSGDSYRAIVVPQTVAANSPLIKITVGGYAYTLAKSDAFTFNAGRQHNFTIKINKRTASGDYEFVFAGESITVWENDSVSHDAVAREYIVINLDKAGTLDEVVESQGKKISEIRNLKLTGQMNSRDFAVMRFGMSRLRALNLKEVKIVAGEGGQYEGNWYGSNNEDEIPNAAMSGKESLTSLVLPDKLYAIRGESGGGVGRGAFSYCSSLSGSLVIPEGVEIIEWAAFKDCSNLTGSLTLPSTLKTLGRVDGYISYWDGAFYGCGFVCELNIPDSVEEIGAGAFENCTGLYGELRLPRNLKKIGSSAFSGCTGMTGSLTIPDGVTDIPSGCFANMGLSGNLTLHDGIGTIGAEAFACTSLKGELNLPKSLEVLSDKVFYSCDFSGDLVLPDNVVTIGRMCFAYNWRLTGTLEIPDKVISIGVGAFANCRSLEGVIFPEGLENIRYEPSGSDGERGAFENCFGIGRIVCKGTIPAYVQDGSFDGVAKDNFTLEVPESAVQQYQSATGWREFKRISAYRNLVIRPNMATAINTSVTRDLVLNADNEWEVVSQPDWVSLDKTSGTGKTELKLTFSEKPNTGEPRKGEVVFMLKGQDYKTTCYVTQYDYEYAEDEVITLQKATKGNGINIMILGDGYNAEDISKGDLMENMKEAYKHFFSIEPYNTYKEYFNVYTAVPVSPESGVGSVNTIRYNRFNTTAKGGVTLSGRYGESDFTEILKYCTKAPTISGDNLGNLLVIMIPNTTDYGGICYMWNDGTAIAYCPMSDYGYPLDFRGCIQHEAGGHGFAKLGDEYIYHNAFIDACDCTCCGHVQEFNGAKDLGWYANLSLSGKFSEVPWSHLIFHEKYSGFVDIFEGGFMHNRGVFRSEQNSCMNNDIPYYSTISREAIVKRIKSLAGEEFSFEDFVKNDVTDAWSTDTKASNYEVPADFRNSGTYEQHPVFMGKLNIK